MPNAAVMTDSFATANAGLPDTNDVAMPKAIAASESAGSAARRRARITSRSASASGKIAAIASAGTAGTPRCSSTCTAISGSATLTHEAAVERPEPRARACWRSDTSGELVHRRSSSRGSRTARAAAARPSPRSRASRRRGRRSRSRRDRRRTRTPSASRRPRRARLARGTKTASAANVPAPKSRAVDVPSTTSYLRSREPDRPARESTAYP